jgi:hypothetical protein
MTRDWSGEPAYIHPQGVMPEGMWFDRSKVDNLLARDVIAPCDDCNERFPEDTTYMVVGYEDDEQERNAAIVATYERPAPVGA